MSFKEFKLLVETICGVTLPTKKVTTSKYGYWSHAETMFCQSTPFVVDEDGDLLMYKVWRIEDIDSEGNRRSNEEPEPEYQHLDTILEHFVPNLTYLQYKKLMKIERIHEHTVDYTINEYYGSKTCMRAKFFVLKDLYKFIQSIT